MRWLVNWFLTTVLLYLWTALGFITPNLDFDLPYLRLNNDEKALALIILSGFIFQVGRVVLRRIYFLFVIGTLGLGYILLPVFWVAFGALLFLGIEYLKIWTLSFSPILLLLAGMITAIVSLPAEENE